MTINLFYLFLGVGFTLISDLFGYLTVRVDTQSSLGINKLLVYRKMWYKFYDSVFTVAGAATASYAFNPLWAGFAIVIPTCLLASWTIEKQCTAAELRAVGLDKEADRKEGK